MHIYLIACDMRDMSYDYEPLFRTLREMAGQEAQPTAWLVECAAPLAALSEHLLGLMAPADGLLIVEITPGTRWAATRLQDQAGPWLLARRP
ncbi:hypothetical protein SAMN02799631_00765 [Methylobacterium sp. 174MFSha1.1]|uniref:hypothetical protein n=1 Tax=Methylobacterium sp. 174MFSha1.1 TaxID=1502749 RepID=UPI0008E4C0D0|nr:hypothetical protein [Methylobacterium sp. 174MFSha1.1]SFU46534.1 hypothetical protein SAMN02799631_00765 [Methylobacterium sp. 174MFSha1.1]